MNTFIKLQEKTNSGSYNINMLVSDNEEKVFIMDNHLLAIWCWARKIKNGRKYSIVHIDKHYDLLQSKIEYWKEISDFDTENIKKISPDEMQGLVKKELNWGNYLSIFIVKNINLIEKIITITHKEGDSLENFVKNEKIPEVRKLTENFNDEVIDINGSNPTEEFERKMRELASFLSEANNSKIILNVDIDFFFDDKKQIFTTKQIEEFSQIIKTHWGKLEIVTIALSPEMCPEGNNFGNMTGEELIKKWNNSLEVCIELSEKLDLQQDLINQLKRILV